MKNPEDCKNINEIREIIDELDKDIIKLISIRKNYVVKAAEFKKNTEEVKADDRVKKMITTRRDWAKSYGINEDLIENIFRMLVNYFINEELHKFKGNT
jgi:isochorismate pyruvate lyase